MSNARYEKDRVKRRATIIFALLLMGGRLAWSQGFVDLNFENAVITPDPSSPYYPDAVYSSSAIPGWTATGFLSPTDIFYNTTSQGSPVVSILGANGTPSALDGAYSIELYGGGIGSPTSDSISQTGLVPANTVSIQFIAQGDEPPGEHFWFLCEAKTYRFSRFPRDRYIHSMAVISLQVLQVIVNN
jgi:hypothetical protein